MLVLGNQIVGASRYGTIGEDIIVRVRRNDVEVKRRRNTK
jgi:hypothetical protein